MPSIRIGFSTDFSLTSELVGIGTTLPTSRLDVRGNIRADNSSGSGGVSTITRYDGFLNEEQRLLHTVSIGQTTKGNLNSLSGEIVIPSGKEITVSTGTSIAAGRIDSLTVTGTFDLPHGGTNQRDKTPEKGTTRFNEDLGTIEFYTGVDWRPVGAFDGSGRGRGVFGGGYDPIVSKIDYINISSTGNALDFGVLTQSRRAIGSCSSSTRGLFAGGTTPSVGNINIIDYITTASAGNALDFGDLLGAVRWLSGASSSTRGIFSTEQTTNVIQYVQISTLGNTLDFGDLTAARYAGAAVSSSTRGVFMGGGPFSNVIDYITIASTGNAIDFGDISAGSHGNSGSSNSVRGLSYSGYASSALSSFTNQICYITIATTGNSVDFGSASNGSYASGSCSTSTRSVFAGGYTGPSVPNLNTIEYVNIMSAGNAQDFGDLTIARRGMGACSDSHGGLGGF